jgi:signal transduction histidine kinase
MALIPSAQPAIGLPDGQGAQFDAPSLPRRWRWRPWRLFALAAVALPLCAMLFALTRALAALPSIDASWRIDAQGRVLLAHSELPALRGLVDRPLRWIGSVDGGALAVEPMILLRVPRWALDALPPSAWRDAQSQLDAYLQQPRLKLQFDGADAVVLSPRARGLAGLGGLFWLCAGMALCLGLVATMVLLVRTDGRNLLFLLMAVAQALNLLLFGIAYLPGLGLPAALVQHGASAQRVLDLATAAAFVHSVTLFPLRLPARRWIAAATWLLCSLPLLATRSLGAAWVSTQAGVIGCGVLVIGLLSWAYRIEPNPHAVLMRRVAVVVQATSITLSLAVAVAFAQGRLAQASFADVAVIWYLFLAGVLLLLPFLSRARPASYELAMLAGVCTLASSLDLLLSALFTLSAFASISLSIFAALAVYVVARQWLLDPTSRTGVLGAERMFENVYRTVREVEAQPRHSAALLTELLRDMFDPLQARPLARRPTRSLVVDDGASLLVPVPDIEHHAGHVQSSVLLRFANRGRHMFTLDDARLTDRVVEQLRRAVAYDKAVERGRSEERLRIAQDLHDDIGARLLTLMYKAQSPEMEDYLRHTLKDLKTLTRGLAASDQRLSHATAEWKADIAQRLAAAQIELSWSFVYDRDVVLGVVQWSALTRVLRELVSNAIQHSCATHLDIAATLEGGRLRLTLADNGIGRKPKAWSHGLGLGGVRKRVKLLGGEVQWAENGRAGVICTVLVSDIDARH